MSTQRTDRTPAELIGGALELESFAATLEHRLAGYADWESITAFARGAAGELRGVIELLRSDAEHLRHLASIKADA
ncbi:hypothetical protein GCM10011374_03370 [Kocuria dechangensis]|uniref:Uncharacterized protein n=1 Tax=Kocuria dechangensis TaxID=1176249 RepID=A0A917GGG9_9MICC|nr:hypothetical protein [Kocuria dechangensis]GGG44401.1 hypothetical protein GCM10011374_03370 [Kocuria dechangensis]